MGEISRVSDVSRPEDVPVVVDATPLTPHKAVQRENNLRVKVLDEIVTRLQAKKPTWQKARILHLSTQLEDSMFNSKESLESYGDASTLGERINQHCLLLATRKNSVPKPSLATTSGVPGVRSFATTPTTSGRSMHINRVFRVAGAAIGAEYSVGGGFGRHGRSVSSSFVVGPPPSPCSQLTAQRVGRQQQADADRTAGGADVIVLTDEGGVERSGVDVTAEQCGVSSEMDGYKPRSGRSHSNGSSRGETTEDDMNDSVDGDNGDDCDKRGEDGAAAVAAADAPAAALASPATRSRLRRSVSFAASDSPAAAVPGNAVLPQEQEKGGRRSGEEEEEDEDEEHARVEAVIAAASGGSPGAAWSGETHADGAVRAEGVEAGVEMQQLFEGDHQVGQHQHQQRKATEAEVKQHALRLLQCRLLLLTHASTCSKESGCCQLAPLCDSVRELLTHMQSCGAKKSCEFPHCSSSKAVLQHKHLCADPACGLCHSVKDLSQKCFWANARHLHKRRLEESHELRRLKRQSEGKSVAPPRKLQAEKTKGASESCFGLDEAGNDLGDITLGFFLRQDKAMKARKLAMSQNNVGPGTSYKTSTTASVGDKRGHDGAAKGRTSPGGNGGGGRSSLSEAATAPAQPMKNAETLHPLAVHRQQQQQQQQQQQAQDSSVAAAVEGNDQAAASPLDVEDVSGGGPEARSVGDFSCGAGSGGGGRHDGRKAAERGGGGLTVVIPPVGSGAVVGHLRSPSEIMLDDIAESLADTTRKPSFARMQSVQAFLDDHVELRQSASFGDVSAMVEHWMSLEDANDADNLEEDNGMDAFSF